MKIAATENLPNLPMSNFRQDYIHFYQGNGRTNDVGISLLQWVNGYFTYVALLSYVMVGR